MIQTPDPSAPPDAPPRSARRVFTALMAFNLAVILAAILLGLFKYPDKATPTRYFGEGRFPTGVSIIQLAAAGVLCALVGRRRPNAGRGQAIWYLMAAGFVFLALDEGFQIHEKIDSQIHYRLLGHVTTNLTDRIDDFIILGYGAAGVAALWMFRGELRKFRIALPWLVFTAAVSLASIAMDALTNREDIISGPVHTWMTVGEDACKLIAEAGFITAAAACLAHARRMER